MGCAGTQWSWWKFCQNQNLTSELMVEARCLQKQKKKEFIVNGADRYRIIPGKPKIQSWESLSYWRLKGIEMACSNFIPYPSLTQEVSIHLYTLQTPQINHCPGHCLPDPPLPSLWSRGEKHEMKARKFTYLDATWWDCSGHVYSGSSDSHTSSQLSAMPGEDTISGHEGRRSIFIRYCTQITNPLSQHPAVTRGTDPMQHYAPMDRTAVCGT